MGYYKQLPERQHAVMEAWKEEHPEWGHFSIYTFFGIASRALKIKKPSEKQIRRVRKTVRLLCRKGYLSLAPIHNEFTGMLDGSGYMPTFNAGAGYVQEQVVEQEEKNDENL